MDPVTMLVAAVVWQGGRPGGFPDQGGGGGAELAITVVQVLVELVFVVLTCAGWWGVFVKAGKPGWAGIIPIYSWIVLLELVEKPIWWVLLLLCCPIVNIVIILIAYIELAKKFGQGPGFAIGMFCLPFVFWPILGFGSAQYMGGSGPRRRRREYDEDDDDSPRRR